MTTNSESRNSSPPPRGQVWIDGQLVDSNTASVSVFDRGFLYGDAVFEALRTYGGRPFALEEHVERLWGSATRMGIDLPWSTSDFEKELRHAIDSTPWGFAASSEGRAQPPCETYLRLMVSRGTGPLALDPDTVVGPPSRVWFLAPLTEPSGVDYQRGITLRVATGARAIDATCAEGAKVSNYLPAILALREAKKHGAKEVLFVDTREGSDVGLRSATVLEGGTSNLLAFFGRTLRTPPLGRILDGITRRHVLRCARDLGLEVREEDLTLEELSRADEACISSSIRELVPVASVSYGNSSFSFKSEDFRWTRALHERFRVATGSHAPLPWT